MKKTTSMFRKFGFFLALAGVLLAVVSLNVVAVSARAVMAGATPTPTATPVDAIVQPTATSTPEMVPANMGPSPHVTGNCLGCHGNEKLVGKFTNGETVSLYIVPGVHKGSFHNQEGMSCIICHADQKDYPHKDSPAKSCSVCHWQMSGGTQPVDKLVFDLPIADARVLPLAVSEACQKCHEDRAVEIKSSAHTRILNEGNRFAPVCADCHSGHDITAVDRQKISQICSKCHLAEYSAYKGSVHGAALEKEGNPDVATCIDCHGAHKVQGPREIEFRSTIASDVCGKCHANKEIMSKYSLSTDVLTTYMDDAHGHTDLLGRIDNSNITKATCYDCHGVHNILSPKNPYSKTYPENLQKTCQQCHKDASITFPSAWLSHKKPSLSAMPGLYLSNLASLIVVLLVIAIVLLFILLDLRRRRAQRTIPPTSHE